MWDDDQDMRSALLAELAATAPPTSGAGLAEVVRRGKRRRRARHLGTALAVVALLGATTAAAAALNGGGEYLPPAEPPTSAATQPTDATWPTADLPAQIPYGTFTPAPTASDGVTILPFPLCGGPDVLHDRLNTATAPADLRSELLAAVRAIAPDATVGTLVERRITSTRPGTWNAYEYAADVTDSGGTGSIQLSVGDFTGTPLAAADAQAFDQANCAPPKRQVFADGTVMQVYAPQPREPFQSLTQVLRVFLPDGTLHQLTVANWGSADVHPDPTQPDVLQRTGAGRPTLPLSEWQLAAIAARIG